MTVSEVHFERFCEAHGIPCTRIEAGKSSTPDYMIRISNSSVDVEIKQIDEDEDFSSNRSKRTIGDHIRAKINEARNQVRPAECQGRPAILLIYNNLDPLQMFGTEQHDFVAAMYGEPTVAFRVGTGAINHSFEGRNKSLRSDKNTSFSAVGHIKRSTNGLLVHVYENIHATVSLDYSSLPTCLSFTRFEL
jgi:hypothetical protein